MWPGHHVPVSEARPWLEIFDLFLEKLKAKAELACWMSFISGNFTADTEVPVKGTERSSVVFPLIHFPSGSRVLHVPSSCRLLQLKTALMLERRRNLVS